MEAKAERTLLWIFITGAREQRILLSLVTELEECDTEESIAIWECLSVMGENGTNRHRKGQGNGEEGHWTREVDTERDRHRKIQSNEAIWIEHAW